MSNLTDSAVLEISRLQAEAAQLIALPNLTQSDRKKADLLISQISSIRSLGVSTDEIRQLARDPQAKKEEAARITRERAFRAYLCGRPDKEIRDIQAGQQTITYAPDPNSPQGQVTTGYLVPIAFSNLVAEGAAQFDPLLDPNVVTLIQEKEFRLRPLKVPGWDLSKISAVPVAETVAQVDGSGGNSLLGSANSDAAFAGKLLNRWSYRLTLRASLEWEEDEAAYMRALNAMARAYGVGFARGIGKDLVLGNGTTAPQGILTAAANSSVSNGTAGKLTLTDILNIYFSVNRIYRIAPKCAWLMDDTSYKYVRAAVDTSGRPLLSVERNGETLMGKPVYVCPSLSGLASPFVPGSIIFGDLEHFVVHSSAMLLRRLVQRYADSGEVAYLGMRMVDSVLFDPTGGVTPPIVYAQIS